IKQCATNVLSNAVKYTQEGSVTLEVGYKECPKVNEASEAEALEDNIILTVRVKDTGIGIKEEDLKKLFSPFERIEEKRNRTIEGTGLGMNIVKQLLDLMDSRLEVSSVYGEGSDFYFEIKQKIIDKEPIGDFSEAYRRSLETREKYQVSFKAPDGRILIIDDTPMNLTVIKGLLKETQLNVETGTSGTEALELVTKKKYDLIFLDHMMPEPDGIQTLKAFGSLEGNLNRDTPCIALTANAVSGAREMYLKAGFDDYITKPIDGEVLEKLIKKLMPEEKLILPGQEGYDSQSDDKVKEEKKEDSIIKNLEGIDYESGIKNCMNEDILKGAIGDFYVSIASEPDLIEEAFKSNDLRTYTVKVHALKSSARIIGANELSAMAMELEEAGNAEDIEKINDKTPTLLELYRSYREKLKPFCEKEGDDDDREEIPLDQLEQAYECLREFAESFDFDSADDIMNTLEDYRIPVDYKDKYDKIKQAVTNVDRDELIRLLEDDK
ncbi:MAG: response regulator, partial [Lachnospiraceae bacterium]|nr:response regulator [Lachnospiraceae bacterium]